MSEIEDDTFGVCAAIRELLQSHEVPEAAFIDDYVANAIVQRNQARTKLDLCRSALRDIMVTAMQAAHQDAEQFCEWAHEHAGQALADVEAL